MIVNFYNNKGGVSKTTTAINIASLLAMNKFKVVVLDLDSQANITNVFHTFLKKQQIKHTIIDLLKENNNFHEIADNKIKANIKNKIPNENLWLVYGDKAMSDYNIFIENNIIHQDKLKNLINDLNKEFDFVILDNPPAISTLTFKSNSFADLIVVPFEASTFSLQGVLTIIETLEKNFKDKDVIMIPTRYDGSSIHKNHIKIVQENIKKRATMNPRNNISVSNSKISFNKYNDIVLVHQNLPLVLSNKYEKNIEKYREEYSILMNEIIEYSKKGQ
ncbi:MAG: ParA family protein [Mycoplasmoidaceae bacterium]